MWEVLTRFDIESANQDLRARREQLLARHAEEIKNLDAERAEVDTLAKMAAAFAEKFKKPMRSLDERSGPPGMDGNKAASAVSMPPGISLFITQAQKSKLRALGIADQQIRDMKPAEAHRILGLTRLEGGHLERA